MKSLLARVFLVLALVALAAIAMANTYGGGVSGTVTQNCVPKSNANNSFSTTVICSDGTTTSIGANKVLVTESNGNTVIAGTLAVTGTTTFTGAMNGPSGATISTTTPVVLTASQSGQLFVSNSTADAVQVFTLPPASTAGLVFCFSLGSSSLGSNREIDVEPQGASDLIIGTTTPAGGTGIATTAGPGHGVKNTHATAVRGNNVCLQSDGVNTYYQRALTGVWAAY
jgi:hypothetical protein